jgi:hypothetical protein
MKPLFLIISKMVQLRVEQNCWFTSFTSLLSTTSGRHFRFGRYRIGFRSKTKDPSDCERLDPTCRPSGNRSTAGVLPSR